MAQGSLLLSRLIGLLSKPAVSQINFRLGPYMISGNDYAAVLAALFYGKVGITINPGQLQAWKAGAAYTNQTFVFASAAFGMTLVDQMSIIHECTHAVNDMHGFRWGATDSDDEASAFVAGALYCFNAASALQVPAPPDPIFSTMVEPFKTAFDIARKIQSEVNPVVAPKDAITLRSRIVAHPTYVALGVTLGTLPVNHGKW